MQKSDHFRFSKVLLATVASTSLLAASASGGSIKVSDKPCKACRTQILWLSRIPVFPPVFRSAFQQQGQDLLENPSDSIVRFGYLSDATGTEPDENTYLILDHNPGGPTPNYDYGRIFFFRGTKTVGILHISRESTLISQAPITALHCLLPSDRRPDAL
jgi:hypothetical protein